MSPKRIAQIENILHYTFNNKELLERAFTHSSYAKLYDVEDNERMEFFGDAVLDMVVSEYLYRKYPRSSAGSLSTMRSKIVSADGLRPIVDDMGIMDFLLVGVGAEKIIASSKKIEANLYEAVVAAVYFDGGFKKAEKFILRTLKKSLEKLDRPQQKDSKTLLQEYCQKRKLPLPEYVLAERTGADNEPTYKYDLYIDGKYICSGKGASKKSAEQDAAKKLVTKWRINSALS